MRFMLCLDETAYSEQALPPVRKLAEQSGSEVHLFHAIVPKAASNAEPYSGSEREAQEAIDAEFERRSLEQRERLERMASSLSAPASIAIVEDRYPERAIVRYADEADIDLIALATHSEERLLGDDKLGDIAQHVTLSGVAPVLLVRPKVDVALDPSAITEGLFVFSSDGYELGRVTAVGETAFQVGDLEDTRQFWLPLELASSLNGGRLVVQESAASIEARATRESGV